MKISNLNFKEQNFFIQQRFNVNPAYPELLRNLKQFVQFCPQNMPRVRSAESKKRAKEKATEARKEFRFRGKSAFLTWSDCPEDMTKETILSLMKERHGLKLSWWVIGQENHQNGKPHFHAVLRFNTDIDSTDKTIFDIHNIHPNISSVKNRASVKRTYEYCRKDCNYIVSEEPDLWTGSDNFRMKKGDSDAWMQYRESKARTSPWPLELPNNTVIEKPTPLNKQRHWYFCAPSNWGKTRWINSLGNKKFFLVQRADDRCFEGYNNEEVIIFDDCYPQMKMLVPLTDTYDHIQTKMPGDQRYNAAYRQKGLCLTIIVLKYDLPVYHDNEAFVNRFNIINL